MARFGNVSLVFADAVSFEYGGLRPAPTTLVANLPYGVAATVVLRTIEQLPGVTRWVAMVQREVGERFAAAPATSAYGVPSVLAQYACEVKVLRAVGRGVFRPVPNVDSVLIGLTRIGPAPSTRVRRLVHDAFAHRRKALAGSLALAGGAEPDIRGARPRRARGDGASRRCARRAARARRVPRPGRAPVAVMLAPSPGAAAMMLRTLAPGKVNLACSSVRPGPTAATSS